MRAIARQIAAIANFCAGTNSTALPASLRIYSPFSTTELSAKFSIRLITAVMRRLEDSWCPMPNRKRVRHAPLRALVALSRRAHPRISPTRGPPGRHGARQNWLRARASRTSTRCELGLESRRAECRDEPGMQLDDIEPADETPCEQLRLLVFCLNLASECNSGACCHGADGYGGIKSPCSSRSPDGSGPSPTPGPNPERPGWSGIVMCDSATLFS